MPQRNGYRSHRGRSAIARQVITSAGSVNGMMPTAPVFGVLNGVGKYVTASEGSAYFGGPKKGGSAPSATGFMVPKSSSYQPYSVFPLRMWSGCPNFTNGAPCVAPNTNNGGNATLTTYRQNFSIGALVAGGPLL